MTDSPQSSFDLWQWILGILAVVGTPFLSMFAGWSGKVDKRLAEHDTEIAVLKNTTTYVKEALERIEEKLETRPEDQRGNFT
jgi:predicted glycosyltransferase